MSRSISLSIAEPCNAPLHEMDPTSIGVYCNQCQKEVVDFTGKSDAEIHQYFKEAKGKVCGRLRAGQLNRSLSIQERSVVFSKPMRNTAATLVIASSISLDTLSQEVDSTFVAQGDSTEVVQTDSLIVAKDSIVVEKDLIPEEPVNKRKNDKLLVPEIYQYVETFLAGNVTCDPPPQKVSVFAEKWVKWELPEFLKPSLYLVRFTGLFNSSVVTENKGRSKKEKPKELKKADPILHEDRKLRVRSS